jgi:type IV pilus biogenesis protein PilP
MKHHKLIKNIAISSLGVVISLNTFSECSFAQGVPFAVTQNDNNTSSGSDLPSSKTPMNMNSKMVNNVINQTEEQSKVRLNQLVGKTSSTESLNQKENLLSPDLSKSQDDLQEMQDIQKKIRLLSLQKEEAQAAIDLWKMLFDVKKEKDDSDDNKLKSEISGNNSEQNEINLLKKQFSQINSQKNNERNKDKYSPDTVLPNNSIQTPVLVTPPLTKQEMSLNASKAKDFIPPEAKVVIIGGSGENRYATVLIPYIGEQDVKIGDSLPGGRTVYSITEASGVTVKEKNGSHTILSFGSSVPADTDNADDATTAASAD